MMFEPYDSLSSIVKHLTWIGSKLSAQPYVAGIVLILLILSFPTASMSTPFTVSEFVGGTVNDQPVSATSTGTADSATGVYTLNWTFSSVPEGYCVWCSIITAAGDIGSNIAREVGNARNIFSINGGNYAITTVASFPPTAGSTGILVTNAQIATSGTSAGPTITGTHTISGDVSVPDVVGIMVGDFLWTPGPEPSQFQETVTKELIRADGGPPIPVAVVSTYTLLGGGSLAMSQLRDLSVTTLSAIPNLSHPVTGIIQYESVVRPVPESVPEPSSFILLCIGIIAVFAYSMLRSVGINASIRLTTKV